MSSIAAEHAGPDRDQVSVTRAIQPGWVRIMHWINAVAMIADDHVRLADLRRLAAVRLHLPASITLGGWLGGALLWHFAAMWLLMVNGLVYLALGFATGRFRRKLLPICRAPA